MTLDEIIASDKVMLTAQDLSGAMGIHPDRLTYYARSGQLPFAYMMSGNRLKVPRIAFLRWGGWWKDIPEESKDRYLLMVSDLMEAGIIDGDGRVHFEFLRRGGEKDG